MAQGEGNTPAPPSQSELMTTAQAFQLQLASQMVQAGQMAPGGPFQNPLTVNRVQLSSARANALLQPNYPQPYPQYNSQISHND
ncbi:hypothetical protein MMC22_006460 [Lobaria immixta]|nr:hypothetical protein [Lobaria immixta]